MLDSWFKCNSINTELILPEPWGQQSEQLVNIGATSGVPRGSDGAAVASQSMEGTWDPASRLDDAQRGDGAHPRDVFCCTLPICLVYELTVSSDGTNCLRNLSLQPSFISPVNPVLAFPRSYLAPLIYWVAGILRTSNY